MHTLACICDYRKESIPATSIAPCDYVSTENMLPNRAGVAPAASTPSAGSVSLYEKGDVLISNIRPYFKKIWLADRDGGCSNDVLVVKPTHCDSDYLYWVLSSDSFFKYMTATSKGTKMPRGDKNSIMRFPLRNMSERDRSTLSSILNPIQRKIALNNRINDYLTERSHLLSIR